LWEKWRLVVESFLLWILLLMLWIAFYYSMLRGSFFVRNLRYGWKCIFGIYPAGWVVRIKLVCLTVNSFMIIWMVVVEGVILLLILGFEFNSSCKFLRD